MGFFLGFSHQRRHAKLRPLFWGGHQQQGKRPGTEPVPLAVGRTSKPKGRWKKDTELAMPIWLHPQLDLEHRSVALLVLLGLLGPPLAPLDAD
jgi:cysteine desulfurase